MSHDSALLLQYRSKMQIKFLLSPSLPNPMENITLFNMPMLYYPKSQDNKMQTNKQESVFVIQKDNFKAKIVRI